jgi:hypothetical protein
LTDDDKRIQAMERAKYFVADACTPGEAGANVVRTWNLHSFTGDPEDLIDDLAAVATERDYWETLSDHEFKIAENRLRRMARRQGLVLQKSRRRDWRAPDYGTYMLVDAATNAVIAYGLQSGYGLSISEVERALTD